MRRAAIALVLAVLSISMAGCGDGSTKTKGTTSATSTSLPSSVPKPNLAKIVPANYVVQKIRYAKLTGQAVPDAVVSSKGPAVGDLGLHPAELQVVSWDEIAERWNVVFDAQKIREFISYRPTNSNAYISSESQLASRSLRLLDPDDYGKIYQLSVVNFRSEEGNDLVFAAVPFSTGSGSAGEVVVVGFESSEASVRYLWFGDGGAGFLVVGSGQNQTLEASAHFWTPVDAHCCPVRDYSFVVGEDADNAITSLRDDRPWLGLFVKAVQENEASSPLEVVGIVPGSPAASLFQEGDVITALVGAKTSEDQGLLGPALVDQLALLKAGSTASFRIQRGSGTTTVTVKLGSLIDSSAQSASPPNDFSVIAI